MSEENTIAVPIPKDVELTALDKQLLSAVFQNIITLKTSCHCEWDELIARLEYGGWNVKWNICWEVEASRNRDYERASGATLLEALNKLAQMSEIYAVEGCP